jgi:hypothetical protein
MSNGNGKRAIRTARHIKAAAILAAITSRADERRLEAELHELQEQSK